MVFYPQESPGNEESRRQGMARRWLEGRDEEEHPRVGLSGGSTALHHEDNPAGRAEAGHRLAGSF